MHIQLRTGLTVPAFKIKLIKMIYGNYSGHPHPHGLIPQLSDTPGEGSKQVFLPCSPALREGAGGMRAGSALKLPSLSS
jgi:hypothetical protein